MRLRIKKERELLEETGMVVSAVSNFLDIDELFVTGITWGMNDAVWDANTC